MKKLNKKSLVIALAGVASMAVAGQASAEIYAGSRLLQKDLSITINGGLAPIQSYSFDITNTGVLEGVGDTPIKTSSCGGSLVAMTSTCTATDAGYFGGSAGAPVLGGTGDTARGAGVTGPNAAESTDGIRGGEDIYSFIGPGGANEYGTGDSVIDDAELIGDATTATRQITESQIVSSSSASGSAEVQSTTGFTLLFAVSEDNGVLEYSFMADPDLVALINDDGVNSASAGAAISYVVTINSQTGTPFYAFSWAPDGTTAGCTAGVTNGGLVGTCTENNDSENLNDNASVDYQGISPTQDDKSSVNPNITPEGSPDQGYQAYGIRLDGIPAGNYSLKLTAKVSSTVRRVAAVPEPSVLALMGLGLAGLGFAGRRQKKIRA